MKTLSKAQLQEKAAEVFEKNPAEQKVFGTLDGNIFLERNESAARYHARMQKLDVIEFTNPETHLEARSKSASNESSAALQSKYDGLRRKELNAELKARGLKPADYPNIAACIAALESDDLQRAEAAAAAAAAEEAAAAEAAASETNGKPEPGADEEE